MRRLIVAVASLAVSAAALAAPQFVNILTGGTSGVYYPLGVGLSQIYGKVMPDAKATVQATKASVENLNLLQDGKGEVAFALGDSVSDAWKGNTEAGFKAPLTKLRAIGGIYSNYIQIIARTDANIKTLADLKGKRVSVGAAKSGTELNTREILKAAGMSYKDMGKVEYLGYAESVDLLKNRQLDATLQSSGLGAAFVKDLAASVDITIVAIPVEVAKKIDDAAYLSAVIPKETYAKQAADVPTVAIRNMLVTSEAVPEDVVYKMTKAMFENLPQLVASHSAAKDIDRATAAQNLPIPLHPGAIRYYKEVGVLK
jgi:uncharacterized protein